MPQGLGLSTSATHPAHGPGHARPDPCEDLRAGDTSRHGQAGAPPHAFNRGTRLRHARLGTWWERVLAVLSPIFLARR
jgi:hypothetical protein